jgi:glycine cleavage system aminomethyltransferase T
VKEQDFVGKEAHLRHREEAPAAILCTLTVDDHASASGVPRFPMGREPILTRSRRPDRGREGPPVVRDERGARHRPSASTS